MAVKRYDGTDWQTVAGKGEQGTSSSITTWVKTATGGETSLTGSSDSSTTLAYTPGQEQFFINGVLQVRGSDYTATNGTSITGITALVAGDIATVTTVNAFSVTGAVPLSTVTANGDLIVGTSSGAVGRLGVGSTGNLLTVAGGVPTWAAPATPVTGSNWTLLNTGGTLLSGSSTVTVSGISGADKIMILFKGASTGSTQSPLSIRINAATANYNSFGWFIEVSASYDRNYVNTITPTSPATDRIVMAQMSADAGSTMTGYLSITGCNSSGDKMYSGVGAGTPNGSYINQSTTLGGYYASSSLVTSVSVLSSVNFDAGTLYVYTSA
jgi:hypothetical protein